MPSEWQRWEDKDCWRWYEASDGRKLISVTKVLDVLMHEKLKSWLIRNSEAKIEKTRTVTANLGTKLHEMIAKDLKGEEVIADPDAVEPFENWKGFRAKHRIQATDTEITCFSEKFGYAGTIDIVGVADGVKSIMDVKTGRVDVKAGYQMAAYQRAWREMHVESLGMAALQIPRDGSEPTLFRYEHIDFCFQRFLCALECFKGLYFSKLKAMNWPYLYTYSVGDWK